MKSYKLAESSINLKSLPAFSESFSSQFDFCSSIPSPEDDLPKRDLKPAKIYVKHAINSSDINLGNISNF